MYTVSERVFITGIAILFCMILMGCVFIAYAVSIWAKHKKEERIAIQEATDRRWERRGQMEVESWTLLLGEKDDEIKTLKAKCEVLSNKLSNTMKLLEASEKQRMKERGKKA